MSLYVRGDERFIRNMPVVGMAPSIYRFNNLNRMLTPYVNEVQFYNPFTGMPGPSYKPGNFMENFANGLTNNPTYSVAQQVQPVVTSSLYTNGTYNIGLVGTQQEITTAREILDKHFSTPKP